MRSRHCSLFIPSVLSALNFLLLTRLSVRPLIYDVTSLRRIRSYEYHEHRRTKRPVLIGDCREAEADPPERP